MTKAHADNKAVTQVFSFSHAQIYFAFYLESDQIKISRYLI